MSAETGNWNWESAALPGRSRLVRERLRQYLPSEGRRFVSQTKREWSTLHMITQPRKKASGGKRRLAVPVGSLLLAAASIQSACRASQPLAEGMPALDSADAGAPYPCPASPSFYDNNLTYVAPATDDGFWQSTIPATQGLDAATLEAAATALSLQPSAFSLLVIRNDFLVLERYFHGSQGNHSNNLHSASKSILSSLVGIALDRGYLKNLEQTVGELLPRHHMKDAVTASITLRHLLTMASGLAWVEDQTECNIQKAPNWVQAILDLPVTSTLGTQFNYSTGNSHLVSAILTEATGQPTPDFATAALLKPLGISVDHWGKDPQGIASGGYDFYMTPRAFARFALLVFTHGQLKGQQLIPAAWLAGSIRPEEPDRTGYHYGYYYWLPWVGGHAVAKMWGFGGQLAYLIADEHLVVVLTNDTHRNYEEFDGDSFVASSILPAIRRHSPALPPAAAALRLSATVPALSKPAWTRQGGCSIMTGQPPMSAR